MALHGWDHPFGLQCTTTSLSADIKLPHNCPQAATSALIQQKLHQRGETRQSKHILAAQLTLDLAKLAAVVQGSRLSMSQARLS